MWIRNEAGALEPGRDGGSTRDRSIRVLWLPPFRLGTHYHAVMTRRQGLPAHSVDPRQASGDIGLHSRPAS